MRSLLVILATTALILLGTFGLEGCTWGRLNVAGCARIVLASGVAITVGLCQHRHNRFYYRLVVSS